MEEMREGLGRRSGWSVSVGGKRRGTYMTVNVHPYAAPAPMLRSAC